MAPASAAQVRSLSSLCAGLLDGAPLPGDPQIGAVRDDSRAVRPGDLFVALPGTRSDARGFIPDALARGAAAVVFERDGAAIERAIAAAGARAVPVKNARAALAIIASRFFATAARTTLTAITGTNGKTTTAHLVEAMLGAAGRRVGMVGTVVYRFGGATVEAPLTTPGPLALHELLARWHAAGCSDVVLEASSHALHQDRLAGCRFRVAALSNVTQDHLDYHRTMDAYFDAKAILFESLLADDGVAVLRVDREDGRRMIARVRASAGGQARGRILSVSTTPGVSADLCARDVRLDGQGTQATFDGPAGPIPIASSLVGDYNLDNLALAVGIGVAHGLASDAIRMGIASVTGVPGRLQPVANDAGILCVVDYAHTPDALERALGALRPLARGRLLAVFGCGGDRDPGKRSLMGQAVVRLADAAIITSDNPRTEDPGRIIDAIVEGAEAAGGVRRSISALRTGERGFAVEPDRGAAIRAAVAVGRAGDVLLIAGKGHEDYQILGTTKIHFDDREEAACAFAAAAGGAGITP